MKSIFISYEYSDDGEPFNPSSSFVAHLSHDLKAAKFDVWFDRESMPSQNRTFHQEIRDAISSCDRMLLIVGPGMATSNYVRHEWQFAYFEAEKLVTPILRKGDYKLMPDELKLLPCADFRSDTQYAYHLKQLIRILQKEPPQLGKLIAVPSLPAHFLSRTDRLVALRDALRADLDRTIIISGVAARVGVHGMGGIGKSVLAAALARDRKIREAFSDGIVWIGVGSAPDLVALQRRVHLDLGGDGSIATEHEGRTKLTELLAKKAVLLVIDDVWRRGDVDVFDVLGPRCRAMITTRDAGLLTSLGGTHHIVELLTDSEALRLLAMVAGVEADSLPPKAHDVLAECGRLPLAVALAGGMVRAGTPWHDVFAALREHELEFLEDEHASNAQHVNLWRTIEVSVRALPDDAQQRLSELAIFPPDEQIPIAAVVTLWQHTGNLSPRHARQLLVDLKQRSLAQLSSSDPIENQELDKVWLHDLIHDYCVRLATQRFGGETPLHTSLLDAYRRTCPLGWWLGPNDGYFFEHLRIHLVAAGRVSELANLLHELRWFEAKNGAALAFDLLRDFAVTIKALPTSDDRRRILSLVDEALRRDVNFIHRHRDDYPQGLFQSLWNNGWWYDCPQAALHHKRANRQPASLGQKLSKLLPRGAAEEPQYGQHQPVGPKLFELLERWRSEKEAAQPELPWLRSILPPRNRLGGPLAAILRGHEDRVRWVVYSPDGRQVVSGSTDKTVRFWDSESGAELRVLRGELVDAFSFSGKRMACGLNDGNTLRVLDAEHGTELYALRGHVQPTAFVAFSADGRQIVSTSYDGTARVWDAERGAELRVLRGLQEYVRCFAVSADATKIAIACKDNSVELWDVEAGAQLRVLRGHESMVTCVAFSTSGLLVVSGSIDGMLRIWDAKRGTERRVIRHDAISMSCVAFSPDGRMIAGGMRDQTVRVWDVETGEQLHILRGHFKRIECVTFSPDGRQIASGSEDATVRLWELKNGNERRALEGHAGYCLAFSPDGRRVACEGIMIDAENGTELSVLFAGHCSCVEFSPNGQMIASDYCSRQVHVWNVEDGKKLLELRGHEPGVTCVAFSPDGQRIVSGSEDTTVRIWNATRPTRLREAVLHVRSWFYPPQAEVRPELQVLRGHETYVTSVAFSPDGRQIVSGSRDGFMQIWDAETGRGQCTIHGPAYEVYSVALSDDGRRIVSGDRDSPTDVSTRVWDVERGDCLEVIAGSSDAFAIAAGPRRFPYCAIASKLETKIQQTDTLCPIAWFETALEEIKTHPSGRLWGGKTGVHLYLIRLEGKHAQL